jgi:hypothetical protein
MGAQCKQCGFFLTVANYTTIHLVSVLKKVTNMWAVPLLFSPFPSNIVGFGACFYVPKSDLIGISIIKEGETNG